MNTSSFAERAETPVPNGADVVNMPNFPNVPNSPNVPNIENDEENAVKNYPFNQQLETLANNIGSAMTAFSSQAGNILSDLTNELEALKKENLEKDLKLESLSKVKEDHDALKIENDLLISKVSESDSKLKAALEKIAHLTKENGEHLEFQAGLKNYFASNSKQ